VADALAMLHSQRPPFLHSDVTSDNVFLQDHAHLSVAAVKLGDLKPHRCARGVWTREMDRVRLGWAWPKSRLRPVLL
jgi:hypothetical protein